MMSAMYVSSDRRRQMVRNPPLINENKEDATDWTGASDEPFDGG